MQVQEVSVRYDLCLHEPQRLAVKDRHEHNGISGGHILNAGTQVHKQENYRGGGNDFHLRESGSV